MLRTVLPLLFVIATTVVATQEMAASELAVRQPMFPTLRQYYQSVYRRPYLDALLDSYQSAEKLEAAANYDSAMSTAVVVVPSRWRRNAPGWGLYVHVSPENTGYIPKGWETALNRAKLVAVSPNGIGNDADTVLRMRIALDTVAAAKDKFTLDDKRIFVGGFSGGASIAARLCVEFPDLVCGAVAECKALPLLDVPAASGVYPGEYKKVPEETWAALREYKRRWYFGTGTKDFNFQSVTAQEPIWKQLGLEIQTEVIEGLGHQDLPADAFARALTFIQGTSGTTSPAASSAKPDGTKQPVHATGGVFWLIPHGTSTTLGGPGTVTVFQLGSKNTREEIAATKVRYAWDEARHGLAATYEFKDLAVLPGTQLIVQYTLQADLDDGNGMHVQSEIVGPAKLPNKLDATMNWGEATLRVKKGR